jgi:hypothetical protein
MTGCGSEWLRHLSPAKRQASPGPLCLLTKFNLKTETAGGAVPVAYRVFDVGD